jgi:hypothetical protein
MKLRIIKLTPKSLLSILQGKTNSLAQNLPDDTEILDAKMDLISRQVSIVVRSDSFSDVAESIPIPELTLLTIEPNILNKTPISQPEVFTENTPLSRYAEKMENEFSPDQRKLLNFTVKDDSVVVKPVTFLKAEWDDINDVVRSLGGRWVKGDIISYWEIPLQ